MVQSTCQSLGAGYDVGYDVATQAPQPRYFAEFSNVPATLGAGLVSDKLDLSRLQRHTLAILNLLPGLVTESRCL